MQKNGGGGGAIDEAELMRRRRVDAVFGMGETHSGFPSEGEEEEGMSEEGGGTRSRERSEVDLRRDVREELGEGGDDEELEGLL